MQRSVYEEQAKEIDRIQKEILALAQKEATMYAKQKQNLQRKVKHLSDASLDTDLLDERARVVLNMAADDEFIILDSEL